MIPRDALTDDQMFHLRDLVTNPMSPLIMGDVGTWVGKKQQQALNNAKPGQSLEDARYYAGIAAGFEEVLMMLREYEAYQ